ncbi:MAG: NAD(P)/FAD-dependent oxidoreductase [Chitinophagaceae bacterium]|nr:NAD(P)/FAD-dependent oxidoreductase [Chitinophagaceae bacterium]
MNNTAARIAIIGAGPAGLTAAYLLAKAGFHQVTVFEKHPTLVGGISRTESYQGFHFDIGGHRFFSKSKEVEALWTEILADELLERPRSSRIYYNQQFFAYPLVASEALLKLGLWETMRCIASYGWAKLRPNKAPANFEEWVANQFGWRLYSIFFKTYTEKVWGIPCTEISADWAAQRIKGLSLRTAISNALFPAKKGKDGDQLIKTLIDSFRYPRLGPGQMWQACRQKAEAMGVQVQMGTGIQALRYQAAAGWQLQTDAARWEGEYDYVISTAPIRQLVAGIENELPAATRQAAEALRYRDFLTVVLIVTERQKFSDNWIYIHDPSVKVGRIQNFKSWSPDMVPDASKACYGLEYFCFEGDGMWQSSDDELAELAIGEMEQIGLCQRADVHDWYIVRQSKAYPVYDAHYQEHIQQVRAGLQAMPGLILVGRNGMHKYNNQDHSMMTAMLAVENIKAGKELYNLWQVNQDAIYIESGERGAEAGGRMVPGSR